MNTAPVSDAELFAHLGALTVERPEPSRSKRVLHRPSKARTSGLTLSSPAHVEWSTIEQSTESMVQASQPETDIEASKTTRLVIRTKPKPKQKLPSTNVEWPDQSLQKESSVATAYQSENGKEVGKTSRILTKPKPKPRSSNSKHLIDELDLDEFQFAQTG